MQSKMIELQRQSRSFGNRDEWEERLSSHRHFQYGFLAWLIAGARLHC